MKNSDGAIAASDPTSLLDDAKTCAYLLNDALECADVAEVAAAVRIVQRSHGASAVLGDRDELNPSVFKDIQHFSDGHAGHGTDAMHRGALRP
ncbi:MAG: hypothetical protein AAFS03_07815, partial [Pseudomonadota bacterium]